MPAQDLVALVDRIVANKAGRKVDMESCLDLNDLVKMRTGNARPVIAAILNHVNGFDNRRAFFALNLLETLMLNGGFPVRFLVSRKEVLNELVRRFPAAPRKKADSVEDYILLLLAKWSKSLGERSARKEEYTNFTLISELLRSKVPQEELDAMILDEMVPKLTPKEELLAEDRLVLETVLVISLLTIQETGIPLEQERPGKYKESQRVDQSLEDRGWKEQVINNALHNQLSELQDQLDSLQLLSDDNRQQVLTDIKAAAPRLVRLARSESMTGDMLERVLALNDEVRSVLGVNGLSDSPSPVSNESMDDLGEKTSNGSTEEKKSVDDSIVYCDSLHVNGKRYVRILNHSDKVVHDICIKSHPEECKLLSADFLPPDETFTANITASGAITVHVADRLVCQL